MSLLGKRKQEDDDHKDAKRMKRLHAELEAAKEQQRKCERAELREFNRGIWRMANIHHEMVHFMDKTFVAMDTPALVERFGIYVWTCVRVQGCLWLAAHGIPCELREMIMKHMLHVFHEHWMYHLDELQLTLQRCDDIEESWGRISSKMPVYQCLQSTLPCLFLCNRSRYTLVEKYHIPTLRHPTTPCMVARRKLPHPAW